MKGVYCTASAYSLDSTSRLFLRILILRLASCKSLTDNWNDYLTFGPTYKDNRAPKRYQNQRDFYDSATYDASLTDLPIIFANLIVSYTKENNCFQGDCIIGMRLNINILSWIMASFCNLDQEVTKH